VYPTTVSTGNTRAELELLILADIMPFSPKIMSFEKADLHRHKKKLKEKTILSFQYH